MSDMNAKDLIQQRVTEAEPNAPGLPPRRPLRRPGGPPNPHDLMMGLGDMPPDEPGDMGEPGGPGPRPGSMRPRGPFSPTEMSMLKDVLLLIATEVMGNDFDGAIARKLMSGAVPEPGELQHILDEAGRIKDLPETHGKLMQKVFQHVQSAA